MLSGRALRVDLSLAQDGESVAALPERVGLDLQAYVFIVGYLRLGLNRQVSFSYLHKLALSSDVGVSSLSFVDNMGIQPAAGKRCLFVFDQVVGQGAAVDRDEGLAGTITLVVDGAGGQFLAAAGFAGDEDGGVDAGDPV